MGRYYDNYPPGFNGKFPWDEDICFLDYDNAFESTLQWLKENPNGEFYADPKELFLAMGGKLKTEDDFYDFYHLRDDIQKAINAFDDEDTVNECNNMKKRTIRLTENELKKIIAKSVKKVLRESIYDANDKFTSSISTEAIPKFKHIDDLDQRNRDKVIDIIENILCDDIVYDEDGIPHVGQRGIIAVEKALNMTIDEMEKNGVLFIMNELLAEMEFSRLGVYEAITKTVKKVLNEKVNYFGQQIIELPGIPSTISIMEYIRENNGPTVGKMQFSFENGKMLICTPLPQDDDILEYYLEEYPLESWHDISGMKRIQCNHGWICYINNRFYHLS